ncbi:MAG: Flp family type IVb pilin [Firmicutes bacterium]|nr:Flp family type IVb pilin [Bacillota bacterium]
MIKALRSMLRDDAGATMVEYAILVALIAAFLIGVVTILGTRIAAVFSGVNSSL